MLPTQVCCYMLKRVSKAPMIPAASFACSPLLMFLLAVYPTACDPSMNAIELVLHD